MDWQEEPTAAQAAQQAAQQSTNWTAELKNYAGSQYDQMTTGQREETIQWLKDNHFSNLII